MYFYILIACYFTYVKCVRMWIGLIHMYGYNSRWHKSLISIFDAIIFHHRTWPGQSSFYLSSFLVCKSVKVLTRLIHVPFLWILLHSTTRHLSHMYSSRAYGILRANYKWACTPRDRMSGVVHECSIHNTLYIPLGTHVINCFITRSQLQVIITNILRNNCMWHLDISCGSHRTFSIIMW